MEITFLGTSSMVPTKDRNHAGIYLQYHGEGLLFDCGEGIQRQIKIAGIKPTKITKVFLSHWHGDHVLGLPGLIQTMSSGDSEKSLDIYGPKGTKKRIEYLFKAFVFDKHIDLNVHEITERGIVKTKQYSVHALMLDHGIETYGFRFVEEDKRKINMKKALRKGIKEGPVIGKLQEGKSVKVNGKLVKPDDVSVMERGKVVSYIADTRLCENCYALASNADLVISEATYSHSLREKSEEYNHMTATQAAQVARESGAQALYLLHFSARYKDTGELEDEAKDIFDNVVCAYDFLKVKL